MCYKRNAKHTVGFALSNATQTSPFTLMLTNAMSSSVHIYLAERNAKLTGRVTLCCRAQTPISPVNVTQRKQPRHCCGLSALPNASANPLAVGGFYITDPQCVLLTVDMFPFQSAEARRYRLPGEVKPVRRRDQGQKAVHLDGVVQHLEDG